MISFKTPVIQDKTWIDPCFSSALNRGCEYNFVNILIWSEKYHQKVAQVCGNLVVRMRGSIGHSYLFPVGPGDVKASILALQEDANAHGEEFRLICLSDEHVKTLEELFPGQFDFFKERDSFDYLYLASSLAELTGKKNQAKRNHINRFIQANPSWRMVRIDEGNLARVLEMSADWYATQVDEAQRESFMAEFEALKIAAAHFGQLDCLGVFIETDEGIVAFSIGQKTTEDTFNVFFEKAYGEIQGAYAIVNREMVRAALEVYPELEYINREDDMGLEGLRKAKESYHPIMMEEKSYAVMKQGS